MPLIPYADNGMIISQTKLGLQCRFCRCLEYFPVNNLQLNFEKGKILEFMQRCTPYNWGFGGNRVEQGSSFKHLGIYFHYNFSWATAGGWY